MGILECISLLGTHEAREPLGTWFMSEISTGVRMTGHCMNVAGLQMTVVGLVLLAWLRQHRNREPL